MPSQSQVLKGKARKRALPSSSELQVEAQLISTVHGDTTQQPQPSQPSKVKKPPTSTTAPNTFELSCTISIETEDINVGLVKNVQSFLEKECISGLCSIERGGALQRLHFQAIFRIITTSTIVVSKLLKTYLKWEKRGEAPLNHHVLVKKLIGVGVHTYIGMLGYCVEDKEEDHFEVVHHNVTNEKLEARLEEYVKFGTTFAKNKVVITSKNLLERCLCYLYFKMHKQLNTSLARVLLQMYRFGSFIPYAQWVVPRYCGGMDCMRADAM